MISFFVRGQALKISQPLIVSDTIDYLEAAFIFQTSDWAGCSKWAHFAQGEKIYDIMLTDDKIRREDHLNLSAGDWTIYLHATSAEGMRITTEEMKLTVKKTGLLKGQPLPEVPVSAAEQIAVQAQRAENIAQSVRDDADAGKFKGEKGERGPEGFVGPMGDRGPAGPAGPVGERGPAGPAGADGKQGPSGKDGKNFEIRAVYPTLETLQKAHPVGSPGEVYAVGTEESNIVYIWDVDKKAWNPIGNIRGPKGDTGPQGETGPAGPRGETGKTGLPGSNGKPGGYYTVAVRQNTPDSIQFGFWGSESDMPRVNSQTLYLPKGPTGERGPQGFMGATGPQGPAGETGPAGANGKDGAPGPAGPSGADGKQGPPGKPGDPGKDAPTPALSIGTVETLAPGSQATAEMTGPITDRKLNLGIPQGKQGKDGSGGTGGPLQPLTFTGTVSAEYDGTQPVNVEIPAGGGEKPWRFINEVKITKPVEVVSITEDANGEKFAVSEVIAINTEAIKIVSGTNGSFYVSFGGTYFAPNQTLKQREWVCYRGTMLPDKVQLDVATSGFMGYGGGAAGDPLRVMYGNTQDKNISRFSLSGKFGTQFESGNLVLYGR